jgi:hypothetical protein
MQKASAHICLHMWLYACNARVVIFTSGCANSVVLFTPWPVQPMTIKRLTRVCRSYRDVTLTLRDLGIPVSSYKIFGTHYNL